LGYAAAKKEFAATNFENAAAFFKNAAAFDSKCRSVFLLLFFHPKDKSPIHTRYLILSPYLCTRIRNILNEDI